MASLTLDRGAQLFSKLIAGASLDSLEEILAHRPRQAGVRIYGDARLSEWLSRGAVGQLARSLTGVETKAVRAILFDKNAENNWALGWHQDRTIAVRERKNVDGFGNWTSKAGLVHVEPPIEVLERMLTVRIHLDEVRDDNGPLLIAPGTHALGRLRESEIEQAVAVHGAVSCFATPGDVWVYRTTILHASEASEAARARRVLQVDFSADTLSQGLEWAGIA